MQEDASLVMQSFWHTQCKRHPKFQNLELTRKHLQKVYGPTWNSVTRLKLWSYSRTYTDRNRLACGPQALFYTYYNWGMCTQTHTSHMHTRKHDGNVLPTRRTPLIVVFGWTAWKRKLCATKNNNKTRIRPWTQYIHTYIQYKKQASSLLF